MKQRTRHLLQVTFQPQEFVAWNMDSVSARKLWAADNAMGWLYCTAILLKKKSEALLAQGHATRLRFLVI